VSGSSEAGLTAARSIGARAIKYRSGRRGPPGAGADEPIRVRYSSGHPSPAGRRGCRGRRASRFPEDRRGQITSAAGDRRSRIPRGTELSGGRRPSRAEHLLARPVRNYRRCAHTLWAARTCGQRAGEIFRCGPSHGHSSMAPSMEELEHTFTALHGYRSRPVMTATSAGLRDRAGRPAARIGGGRVERRAARLPRAGPLCRRSWPDC